MFNLKEWYVRRKRAIQAAKKEEQDMLALSIVLENKQLLNKVAGVYLNGRQPLSGKDLLISGKTINLNCTAFYGGTFEGCKFVNAGSDKVLLNGSHLVVSGSTFYGTKFSEEDSEVVLDLIRNQLERLEKRVNYYEVQETEAFTMDARNEATAILAELQENILDIKRVKAVIEDERQSVAVRLSEGGE